jgi:hypothetical protein
VLTQYSAGRELYQRRTLLAKEECADKLGEVLPNLPLSFRPKGEILQALDLNARPERRISPFGRNDKLFRLA